MHKCMMMPVMVLIIQGNNGQEIPLYDERDGTRRRSGAAKRHPCVIGSYCNGFDSVEPKPPDKLRRYLLFSRASSKVSVTVLLHPKKAELDTWRYSREPSMCDATEPLLDFAARSRPKSRHRT